ncbi:photosystem II protein, Psb35-related [Altericista sp. CCNU0014]|uniref:photosystem II protein, Psb35-related n=1 Tax=Altericista sp. CCNU0014 TaxID=3082949 RepID=UPI00384E8ECA
MMTLLISVIVLGWAAAAILGTQAYFRGEQTKPIHERNWRSASFERLATSFTGQETDYTQRTPGFVVADAFTSSTLSSK